MKYNILNKNWNAQKTTAIPEIKFYEDNLLLSFQLNDEAFEHIDENDTAEIEFHQAYAYKLIPLTKNEYFQGNYRFQPSEIPWGNFYEIPISKAEIESFYSNDEILPNNKDQKLKHFILFFQNYIFECTATDADFHFKDESDQLIDELYPKGYLKYFLTLFASQLHQLDLNRQDYLTFTNLYIQLQGIEEFQGVKREIKRIREQNQFGLFLKYINHYEIENFGFKQLHELIKTIEEYQIIKNDKKQGRKKKRKR